MFLARHAAVEHRIRLPLSADEAFPLFTPEGERLWIAEWNPRYFYPSNGEALAGMVFTTGEGEELTFWTVVDLDHQAHAARYSRVTPASRSAIVTVSCAEAGENEADVSIGYMLTGLSEAGNAAIDAFIDRYPAMIEQWRTDILAYIERSRVKILP